MVSSAEPGGTWPLVARQEEMALLTSVIERAEAADPSTPIGPQRLAGAVVVGAAGVGKSRLVRECVQLSADAGRATVWAMATAAGSTIPYGAFAHLAPEALPASSDDRFSLHLAFARELTARADGRHLVIGVDDAHLLDPAGALLVAHLAMTGTATVMATVREGEPAPDPITRLWKDDVALRVDLQRLSIADIEDLARAALRGDVGRPTVLRLAELSSGNVLFARELILAGLSSGALRQVDGIWRWDGAVPAAPRLVELVSERLAELDDDHTDALGLVVLGEPLRVEVFSHLAGDDALTRLERRGLIRVADAEDGSRVHLGHPLYGEVLSATLGTAAHHRLARRLADTIDADPEARFDDALRSARWRLDADGHADPVLLAQAARKASSVFDYPLAERLGRAALDDGGGADAALSTADALIHQNRFAEAEDLLAKWENALLTGGDASVANAYLGHRYVALCTGLGRIDEAMAAFDRFTSALPHAPWPDRADAYRVKALVDVGRLGAGLEIGLPLTTEDDRDEDAVLICVDSVAKALCYVGRTQSAVAVLDRAREPAARRSDDFPRATAWIAAHDVMALFLDGHLSDAVDLIAPFHDPLVRSGDDNARGVVALVIGRVKAMQGLAASARRWMLEALAAMEISDSAGYRTWALAILAQTEAMLGDHVAAYEALDAGRRSERLSAALFEVDFALAETFALQAAGQTGRAIETAVELSSNLREQPAMEALVLHTALRLGARAGQVTDRLEEIAAGCESTMPKLFAEHARAVHDRSGPDLEDLAERYEALGSWPLAAEAAAAASVAFRESSVPASARRTGARCRQLAQRFDALPTPAMEGADDPLPLSRREREVAGLAAQGLTNAEIAGRLVVSVRTVESHLHQAFAKLGVDRRSQLAELLDRSA
ncbi:MAG: AAA family ATPase [Acidimicrobiales bacterium]|nr:AAA family ATPase [Acidimicrobiales bacterium]